MQEGKVSKGQVVKEGFSGGWKEGWSWARPWRKGPIWVSLRKCLNRGVQRETKGKHGWLDEKLEGKRPEELVVTLIALWEWDGRKVKSWSQRVWGSAMRASCHCLAFGKNRLLREVPLPTLMTLELSPHQSLLWLTAHPWDPSTNLVLRINSASWRPVFVPAPGSMPLGRSTGHTTRKRKVWQQLWA